MVHCHAVHLPLGALLIPCTMWRTGNYYYWDQSAAVLLAQIASPPASDDELACPELEPLNQVVVRLLTSYLVTYLLT